MPAPSAVRPPDSREFKGHALNVSGIGSPRKSPAELDKEDDPHLSGSRAPLKADIESPGKREKRGRDVEDQENALESAPLKRRRGRISEGSIFNVPTPSVVIGGADEANHIAADADASNVAHARTQTTLSSSVEADPDSYDTLDLERASDLPFSTISAGPSKQAGEEEEEVQVTKSSVTLPLSNVTISLDEDEAEEFSSFNYEDREDEEGTLSVIIHSPGLTIFDIPTLDKDEAEDPSWRGSSDDDSEPLSSSSGDEDAVAAIEREPEELPASVEFVQESQRKREAKVEGEARIIKSTKHLQKVGICAELRNLPEKKGDSHCTKRPPESSRCIVWFWMRVPSRRAPVNVKVSSCIPKQDLEGVERYSTLASLLETFHSSSQRSVSRFKFGGFVPPKENYFKCRYGNITTIEGDKVIWTCRFRYRAAQLPDEAPGTPIREHIKTAHAIQDVQWEEDRAESCHWVSCKKFMRPPVDGIPYHGSHVANHAYQFVCPFYSKLLRQPDGSYIRACIELHGRKKNLRDHLSGYHKVVVNSLSQRMHSEWDQLAVGETVALSVWDGLE